MKYSGITILQGVEFSIFLWIFEWRLNNRDDQHWTREHVWAETDGLKSVRWRMEAIPLAR